MPPIQSRRVQARHFLAAGLLWPGRVALRCVARTFGFSNAFRSADRRLLEDVILRYHAARPAPLDVLFVGVSRDTANYQSSYFASHRCRTLDIDPAAARYGGRWQHVVACASRAAEHFEPASLDLIVCSGVFGWGLDAPQQVDASLRGFHRLLRTGGELIIGWNDAPWRRPLALHGSAALAEFARVAAPPLRREVVAVPGSNRHRFEFFCKPSAAPARCEMSHRSNARRVDRSVAAR